MSAVRAVGTGDFDAEVLHAAQPVVVDFWAEWCPPCRALGPVLDKVAAQYAGQLKVVKVNVDENEELAGRYGASRIPNLVYFKQGQIVDSTVGFMNEAELAARFDAVLR